MENKRTVQVVHFGGREFRRVTWMRPMEGVRAVIVVFAVTEHVRPGVFRGTFMGRREVAA